jgi:hypothetical protein
MTLRNKQRKPKVISIARENNSDSNRKEKRIYKSKTRSQDGS